jgi:hypothetical protein
MRSGHSALDTERQKKVLPLKIAEYTTVMGGSGEASCAEATREDGAQTPASQLIYDHP